MRDRYSVYEAKAHLSAILRQVREGRTVYVTHHGEPVAEIRPVAPEAESLEQRLAQLTERGILVPAEPLPAEPVKGPRRPGALKRFLADRD